MAHQVVLTWTASTDASGNPSLGYDVLRGTVSGGPYTKVNTTLITADTFTDVGPFSNLGPFFYVAESQLGNQVSSFSNETPAVFLPPVPPTNLSVSSVS